MAVGVGVHEQRQRAFGIFLADGVVLDAAGQGTAHQNPRAVADPVADLLDAGRFTAEGDEHLVHGCREVGYRIDQGAVQVEHHQTRQAHGEQRLGGAHHLPTWASSACMARITSA
ncbi:hypothetical protein D3C81_1697230 [compost metagenome]